MLTKGRVTAAIFIEFLKRLMAGASGPIFVIVDGHPTHRAKSVARFVAEQGAKLALFFLPAYAPELNPDEYVWNDLKANGIGRRAITSPAQMKRLIVSHLRQLQKLPGLVPCFVNSVTYFRATRLSMAVSGPTRGIGHAAMQPVYDPTQPRGAG